MPHHPASGRAVLRALRLGKRYSAAKDPHASSLMLFGDLDLEVHAGEMVAIIGRSGAGKSTLLHLLAGLERPTSGEVWLKQRALHALSMAEQATLRNQAVGYVWQFHYLLPEFSAEENVALPLLARGERRSGALRAARLWLNRVGLAQRAKHRPGELSGGEQQRVAIARALVTEPDLLLADEPTGDLDGATATELFAVLQQLCHEQKLAAVLVTHNEEIAARCDRVLQLKGGRLEPVSL